MVTQVLPQLSRIVPVPNMDTAATRLQCLRVLAELTAHSGKLDAQYINAVFNQCLVSAFEF